MEEYEYSIKAKSVKPYIEYCEKNKYKLIEKVEQNRKVYENRYSKDIIARITTSIKDGKKEIVFDCKNIGTRNEALKISQESLPFFITEDNIKEVESFLNVLNFYQSANNNRIRYVYKKSGVKLEIDDYTSPVMCVIGIEGEKQKVDKVYNDLKDLEK